jgi:hypothetical protein
MLGIENIEDGPQPVYDMNESSVRYADPLRAGRIREENNLVNSGEHLRRAPRTSGERLDGCHITIKILST